MVIICLFFSTSEPEYAYKRYAYNKQTCIAKVKFANKIHIKLTSILTK